MSVSQMGVTAQERLRRRTLESEVLGRPALLQRHHVRHGLTTAVSCRVVSRAVGTRGSGRVMIQTGGNRVTCRALRFRGSCLEDPRSARTTRPWSL
jgi:hypothetical protein